MDNLYNIVLKEKPLDEGLTKVEIIDMFDMLSGAEAIPIEIQGQNSVAMGFINLYDAELMNYRYAKLNDFVSNILDDIENENPDCEYIFQSAHCDHTIWLSR